MGTAFFSETVNVPESTDVTLISCDSSPGYLDAMTLFMQAAQTDVKAVVFYTQKSDYCDLQDYTGPYGWIYTMKSANDATLTIERASTPDPFNDGTIYAAVDYTTVNGTSPAFHPGNDGGPPSPTTAIAMIILYSITGVITGLFLLIIVTGAVRAHRHPERYGPRNIIGRPRQSRAKGLARAMLETLPIVKFGEREEPKPGEVEMGTVNTTHGEPHVVQEPNSDPAASKQQDNVQSKEVPVEEGIAAAVNPGTQAHPDHQGCSICTEDFEAGQDQRVLPCDHRFHPECVDPWLLNVSGTCPLCRIDLRPTAEQGNENGVAALREGEAPPLGPQDTAGERQRMTIRRSIVLGIMGVGRPGLIPREERVAALRRLREEMPVVEAREEQAAVAETPEEARRTRRRLGDLLRRLAPSTGEVDSNDPVVQEAARLHVQTGRIR